MNMEIDDKQKALVREVIDILERLKSIDTDTIDFILAQVDLVKPFFPKEVLPAIESFQTDFKLVRIFSEQARKYDQGSTVFSVAKWLFGGEKHAYQSKRDSAGAVSGADNEEAHRVKAEDTPA